MGYYYKAEPENAVPAKSWATPKTHVPGSPVKERGLRFLMPEIGRWASKDPLEEQGGLLLYGFAENNSINKIDPVGMVSWPTLAELAAALEVAASGAAFVYGWLPDSWINAGTLFWLNRFQPAGDFYQRGVSGGGPLIIVPATQSYWGNIIDRIAADPGWLAAVERIKARACSDIAAHGYVDGGITEADIHGPPSVPDLTASLTSSPNLGLSLHDVDIQYEWKKNGGCCYDVKVGVADTWNFHRAHVWTDMEHRGVLHPFHITINMGDAGKLKVCCGTP